MRKPAESEERLAVRNAISKWSQRASELDDTKPHNKAMLATCNRQIAWLTIRLGQIAAREEHHS